MIIMVYQCEFSNFFGVFVRRNFRRKLSEFNHLSMIFRGNCFVKTPA